MIEVAIALGTNLGNRMDQLQKASSFCRVISSSSLWEQSSVYATKPVECPPESPDYYNAVVIFEYEGSPQELLAQCKSHEKSEGRLLDSASGILNAPRPIDVDILYFGEQFVESASLVIPHPRIAQRRFVLEPLSEIRPNLILPNQKYGVSKILSMLDSLEPPLTLITKHW